MIKKLFSLILAIYMLCFAGCADSAEPEPTRTIDDTRDSLISYEWMGLSFYLGRDFQKVEEGPSSIAFSNGLMRYELSIWALDQFGNDANSSQKFANQYIHMMQDTLAETQPPEEESTETKPTEPLELDVEIGHDNGIYYAVVQAEEECQIYSFYVDSHYGWMACIRTNDYETYQESILNYLTLGKIVGHFDLTLACNA